MAASESGLEKTDWVKKGKRFFFEFYQNQRGTNLFFSVQGALDQRANWGCLIVNLFCTTGGRVATTLPSQHCRMLITPQ